MTFTRRATALASLLVLAIPAAYAAPAKPTRPAAPPPAGTTTHTAPAPKAATAAPHPNDDTSLDRIAAMVNDEAVLASDVEEQVYLFLQRTNARPDSLQLDTLRHQVLDQLIDEKLLLAEAKRRTVVLSDAELEKGVEQAIDDVKQRLGSDAAFQEQLGRENTTEAQLRDQYRGQMRSQLLVRKLVESQFPRRPVPQNEAETYFNAHKDKFPKVPGEVRLSVIQIPPEADSVALSAGYAKAMAARKRIVAGTPFAKVAQEASDDPGTAKSGGDLGYFAHGAMEKGVEEAAFTLKLNELSQPVRTPYGWHIVQALDRDTLKTAGGKDSLDAEGKAIPEAHARHILIRVQPTDDDVARAKALAGRVRDEARKGTNFATLVHRYSKYDGNATPEGDVGFVSLGGLQPQIRQGLDSLEVGQVSDVLPNQAGFNVFKVTDRHAEREYTVDEIRKDLPDAVAQVQFRDKYEAWLKTLRSKAQIQYRTF